MDVAQQIDSMKPRRRTTARALVVTAVGTLLAVGQVALLPVAAHATVTEIRTPLSTGVEAGAPLVVSGSTVISGTHRSTNGGASWVTDQTLTDVRASMGWRTTTIDALVGVTTAGTAFQAVTYDLATGASRSYPVPWLPTSISTSWAMSDLSGTAEQPYVTAYNFVTGTSVTANSPPVLLGWPSAEITPSGAILWWGYDAADQYLVAAAPSPSSPPSAWVTLGGMPEAYSVSATELVYVMRTDLTTQVCKRSLAAITSVACSGSIVTPVNVGITLCDFGTSSIVSFANSSEALNHDYTNAIWSGSVWTTIPLSSDSQITDCSPRGAVPVTSEMYVETRDVNGVPSVRKIAADGSVTAAFGLPRTTAGIQQLGVTWDRVVGEDDRDGALVAHTAWSRPVSSTGFGSETLYPEQAYRPYASAGRTALAIPLGTSVYDRNVQGLTLSRNELGISGPYMMEAIFSPLSVTGWNIIDVNGRTIRTLPGRGAALFGSVFVSWVTSPPFVALQLLVADVDGGLADRYLDLPTGLVCSDQTLELWGDYVAAQCGTGVAIISLKDGHLVQSINDVWLSGIGDGYVVVRSSNPDLTYDVSVRTFAGTTLGTISSCTQLIATDGMGHVACATATELVWQEYPVTTPGRVLGWLAPSSFSQGSWTPEVDVTRSFRAGLLRISKGGTVVRELAVPPSPDGSLRGVSWDGKNSAGAFVTGMFTVELVVTAPEGTAVKAVDGLSAPTFQVSRFAPGAFVALAPSRTLDTRESEGGMGAVAPQGVRDLQITGHGGVPADGVAAVVLNVTAVGPQSAGYLSVYPSGEPAPVASNLNFVKGQNVPNLVLAKVGAGGKVSIRNGSAGATHVVVDVAGYFVAGTVTEPGGVTAVAPSRLLETRVAYGGSGPLPANGSATVQVTGRGGVPASGVSAVIVNLTAVSPTRAGFLSAYPTGGNAPDASNVNFVARDVVPNLAFVKLGADGSFTVRNGSPGTTDVLADVAGYVVDGAVTGSGMFVPLAPARVLDTRPAYGGSGAVGANAVKSLAMTGVGGVPASGVSGVVLNVTAVASAGGFLTVYPADVAMPNSSNLNFTAGQVVPNLVAVKLSGAGAVAIRNGSPGSTNVIADVAGYFTS